MQFYTLQVATEVAMVSEVSGQYHRLAPLPGFQPEGAIGYDLAHIRPFFPVIFHNMLGKGVCDEVGHQMEKVSRWLFQLHRQRDVIESPYTHGTWVRVIALMEGSGSFNIV